MQTADAASDIPSGEKTTGLRDVAAQTAVVNRVNKSVGLADQALGLHPLRAPKS